MVKNIARSAFEDIENAFKIGCIHGFVKMTSGDVIAVRKGIIIPMLTISANALKTINKINNANRILSFKGMKFFKEEIANESETGGEEFTLNY
tara:strand:+ start:220 stop:498 length:279 start_codon:yes stop_codon:yes gene_type:complete